MTNPTPHPSPWHRLFGLSLVDFFKGTNVTVELEVDLSHHKQLLDVILIRKGTDPVSLELPDGFDELAPFNLVTFKSHQDTLDRWALCELIGHYVNYRKQSGESMRKMRPESDYRLYAVCVRFPQDLVSAGTLQPVREGVWDAVFPGVTTIRIIVVHQLPEAVQNAILLLFSAQPNALHYARDHYRTNSPDTSTLLNRLLQAYMEDPAVPSQLKEEFEATFRAMPAERLREIFGPEKMLETLTPEERLKGLRPEERLKGLPPEERLEGLPPEELRAALEFVQRKLASGEARPESN